MSGALILAGIILVTLVLYSVLGGADFGAGFWDLMCAGKRWQQQRDLIASAIHPSRSSLRHARDACSWRAS